VKTLTDDYPTLAIDSSRNHPAVSPAFKKALAPSLRQAEKSDLLDRLARNGELLDYFITTFKGRNFDIACILENGFTDGDYENLKEYFADREPSQSEMNNEEGAWLDRSR
jgi:hypothetical protein